MKPLRKLGKYAQKFGKVIWSPKLQEFIWITENVLTKNKLINDGVDDVIYFQEEVDLMGDLRQETLHMINETKKVFNGTLVEVIKNRRKDGTYV